MDKTKSKCLSGAVTAVLVGLMSVSSAFGQIPGATPDTVKLRILDTIPAPVPTFSVEILVSLDSALTGGSLGFSWSDTANWRYDSVVFGPGLRAWPIHLATKTSLANSMGKLTVGGADFGGAPFPPGPDQSWATMFFSLKSGDTATLNPVLFDSVFVPPAGDFLLIYHNSGTQVLPNFIGPLVVNPSLLFFCDRCNIAGDANNNGSVNVTDVTYLIARIFAGGPAPRCCREGDTNGSGLVNIADITYLIALIFAGGPVPVCGPAGMGC